MIPQLCVSLMHSPFLCRCVSVTMWEIIKVKENCNLSIHGHGSRHGHGVEREGSSLMFSQLMVQFMAVRERKKGTNIEGKEGSRPSTSC